MVISAEATVLQRRHTGTDRRPVDQDSAGAAPAFAASVFRTRETQVFAEKVEQRSLFFGVDVDMTAIDPELLDVRHEVAPGGGEPARLV